MTTTATDLLSRGRLWIALIALVSLVPAFPAHAQDEGERRRGLERRLAHGMELVEMLEQGIAALDALRKDDLRDMVADVAEGLRERLEMARRGAGEREREREHEREGKKLTERQIVEHRAELFRLAFRALAEAGREAESERVMHAIHAYELMLEGERGDAAREIREGAPKWREEIELLGLAAHIFEELGMRERMHDILEQRDRLWPGWRERGEREQAHDREHAHAREREHAKSREREQAQTRERERDREHATRDRGPDRERRMAMHRIEMLRTAMPALLEAGRRETAELVERAIRAIEVNLEGREDAEARQIREESPGLGQQIEILGHASKLWAEFGHEAKAAQLRAYADEMLAAFRARQERNRAREGGAEREREQEQERARDREPRPERGDRVRAERERGIMQRMEELRERMAELERELERMRRER